MSNSRSDVKSEPAACGWLKLNAAVEYLGYSANTIRRLCRERKLKHSRGPTAKGDYRFRREWLDAFMEDRAIEPIQRLVPKPKPAPLSAKTPLQQLEGLHASMKGSN